MTIRSAISWLIFIPVAAVVLAFAVANRAPVRVSLDPINTADPVLSFSIPLFLLLFAVLALGVLLGGIATWTKQSRYRRGVREARERIARLEDDELRRSGTGSSREPEPSALPAIHPF